MTDKKREFEVLPNETVMCSVPCIRGPKNMQELVIVDGEEYPVCIAYGAPTKDGRTVRYGIPVRGGVEYQCALCPERRINRK